MASIQKREREIEREKKRKKKERKEKEDFTTLWSPKIGEDSSIRFDCETVNMKPGEPLNGGSQKTKIIDTKSVSSRPPYLEVVTKYSQRCLSNAGLAITFS